VARARRSHLVAQPIDTTEIGEREASRGRLVVAATAVTAAAQTPRGIVPMLVAAAFGLGAGIVGAAIYFAVIAIAHLEIGIVAILIGYMVGYSVRRGARGRGGLRFQILAAALTYFSVALAYAPLAIQQAMNEKPAQVATQADGTASTQAVTPEAPKRPSGARALLSVVLLSGLIVALPVLVVIGSFPSGLISAFIIAIGMRQAWRMTGAPVVTVAGPYRVGSPQPAAS